jgi:peptidoglycan/LPS O-acetylase OafA/YrhL
MTAPETTPLSPGSAPARPPRLLFLDGIRALAAVYVVLHHAWLAAYVSFPRNAGPSALSWLVYGQMAVAVFIVVSGFSLSLATIGAGDRLVGGTRRFIRRRAWRILPAYWAALAFSVIVLGTLIHHKTGEAVSLKAIVVHGFLLQDIFGSVSPNGAFWSIAVEWQIYFLFPLLIWGVRRKGPVATALATTAVVVASYLLGTNIPAFSRVLHLTPQFLALFAFGMVSARVVGGNSERWRALPWGLIAGACTIAMFLVVNLFGSVTIVKQYFWVDIGVGVTVACIIAALADGKAKPLRGILEWRPIVFMGMFSYSLYLTHVPVLRVVELYVVNPRHLSPNGSFFLSVLIGLPSALVFAYCFFRLFERPFLGKRSIRALFYRRTRPATV